MSSKSKARLPFDPLISIRMALLATGRGSGSPRRPRIAPPLKRARNVAASSTVTGAVAPPTTASPPSSVPLGPSTTGRSVTNVLHQAVDVLDQLTGDVLGEVDDVRTDVPERTGAGPLLLQLPSSSARAGSRSSRPGRYSPARAGSPRTVPRPRCLASGDGRDAPVGEPTMASTPCSAARRAAAAIDWASATVFANGFSHSTCLPASRAATAISAWVSRGADVDQVDVRYGRADLAGVRSRSPASPPVRRPRSRGPDHAPEHPHLGS